MPRQPLTEWEQSFFHKKSRAKGKTQSAAYAGKPRLPEYLSDVAKAKWKEMVKYLSQRGVLTPGDGPQLEILCTVWARWRQLVAEIEKDGPIVDYPITDNSGNVTMVRKESPASKVAQKLETQLRQLLKELTLTVASREHAKPVKKSPEHEPLPPNSVGAIMRRMKEEQENSDESGETSGDSDSGRTTTS